MSQFEVFLAEDNLDHAHLATECLRSGKPDIDIGHFPDGPSLLSALKARTDCGRVMPNLLLLDLNMPGMDGFEVLATIKKNTALRSIPVVVISTSKMVEDIRRALLLNANSYSVKSMDYELWERTLLGIRDYWCEIDQTHRLRDMRSE